ncbi:alpha/beta fold hydrolase [Salinadaptatus halalkaliphilus]|uniref:alpha/beta fold hydrolase n=1 Tax=Salinadaptatus halalkaliphilus TaxID=2419781 RepID=UPI001FE3A1E0|nr:alpha/beta fold hydrolase [Salinadaptatus halalkaliphilus]
MLVHGAVSDHRFWELGDVRRSFAKHRTVHAMDYRGVGQSGDGPAYELAREFEDVAAVVDATSEPAALLGHSGGALLAIEAARRTDNLEALVLYEPRIQMPAETGEEAQAVFDDMRALLKRGKTRRRSSSSCRR